MTDRLFSHSISKVLSLVTNVLVNSEYLISRVGKTPMIQKIFLSKSGCMVITSGCDAESFIFFLRRRLCLFHQVSRVKWLTWIQGVESFALIMQDLSIQGGGMEKMAKERAVH